MSELQVLKARIEAAKEKRIKLAEQLRASEQTLAKAVDDLALLGLTPEDAKAEITLAETDLTVLISDIEALLV